MRCPNCGKYLNENQTECDNCGAQIKIEPKEEEVNPTGASSIVHKDNCKSLLKGIKLTYNEVKVEEEKPHKEDLSVPIIFGILIIIGFIGAIVLFVKGIINDNKYKNIRADVPKEEEKKENPNEGRTSMTNDITKFSYNGYEFQMPENYYHKTINNHDAIYNANNGFLTILFTDSIGYDEYKNDSGYEIISLVQDIDFEGDRELEVVEKVEKVKDGERYLIIKFKDTNQRAVIYSLPETTLIYLVRSTGMSDDLLVQKLNEITITKEE